MESVNVTSSEKNFIEFLIDYIVETNPGDLQTNLNKISQHIQDKYDPKHELNLYRKQFGNINDCVKKDGAKRVFQIEGTSFKFLHHTKVEEAHQAGILTETAWARFQDGRRQYLVKHLNLCKSNKMNICKKCEGKYMVAGNEPGRCSNGKGDPCIPQYDFTVNEDVLQCEI